MLWSIPDGLCGMTCHLSLRPYVLLLRHGTVDNFSARSIQMQTVAQNCFCTIDKRVYAVFNGTTFDWFSAPCRTAFR